VTPITPDQAKTLVSTDKMIHDVASIIEQEEAKTYTNMLGKTGHEVQKSGPSCATVTRIPAFGSALNQRALVTKVIDFGSVGCWLNGQNYVRGRITIQYNYDPAATTRSISYSLTNFYHNSQLYQGRGTVTRSLTGDPADPSTVPTYKMSLDLTVTPQNQETFKRTGYVVRTYSQGGWTADAADDVVSVTGIWSNSFVGAFDVIGDITTPMLIKNQCGITSGIAPVYTSGTISFTRQTESAVLDYGDGSCTPAVTFTTQGSTTTL